MSSLVSSPRDPNAFRPADFRAVCHLARERFWIIVLSLVLAGCGAAAYLMKAPKIYAAKLLLQVEQEEQKILNIEQIQRENLQSLELLKTIEQTMQSRALLQRVFEANKLAQDPRFAPAGVVPAPTPERLLTRLEAMVSVRLRKGTRLIDIKVEHTNAAFTAFVANSLVKEYLRMNLEHNAAAAEVASELLETEAKRLKAKLEQSENALQAYKEATQAASLEERQNVVVEKLKELSQKVTEAKSLRITHEAALRQVEKFGQDVEALMVVPAVANDPSVSEIRSHIAKAESELANIRQRYKEKHPKYIQATSQLAEWKNALARAVLNVPATLKSAYESARAAEESLDRALKEQEAAAIELNKLSLRYNALLREVETDRSLYQTVFSRIKENSVTKELKPSKVRIIQPASVPERPVKPQPLKVILLALLAGLGGGIGLALLLNALDSSLKTVDETEQHLGLPVLATVPRLNGKGEGEARRLVMAEDNDSPEAEAFRTLRTSLSMIARKDERRVFLFTSAIPAEGKTFCSMNYGASLAQQGLRTVVIDCDLRRPMVEKSLSRTHGRGAGVSDFLTGHKSFEETVHPTRVENLFYIPAGTHCPNPSELLAKTGVDGMIDEALRQFDRVIIDSPPIHAVSDTLLILNRVQTVCLVLKARRTPRNAVRRAAQLLLEAEAPLVGVVMNHMPRSGGGYYYDSYYSYSYHGYYGAKGDRKKGRSKKAREDEQQEIAA